MFGALFVPTEAGAHLVRLVAAARAGSKGSEIIVREETLAFGVRDDDDEDNDGLPDSWEGLVGTTVGVADAALDPDGDGLSSLQEHRLGTLPLVADSDGGGETDGSEVANG